MPRPYPNRRRRRPQPRRRRPPRRLPGRDPGTSGKPMAHGFTGPWLGPAYDMLLPFRGRPRRAFFNRAAVILALVAGYAGALQGYQWAGPLGAIVGLGCGLASGCYFLKKMRFYRG